jgi:hypothetical protein
MNTKNYFFGPFFSGDETAQNYKPAGDPWEIIRKIVYQKRDYNRKEEKDSC